MAATIHLDCSFGSYQGADILAVSVEVEGGNRRHTVNLAVYGKAVLVDDAISPDSAGGAASVDLERGKLPDLNEIISVHIDPIWHHQAGVASHQDFTGKSAQYV